MCVRREIAYVRHHDFDNLVFDGLAQQARRERRSEQIRKKREDINPQPFAVSLCQPGAAIVFDRKWGDVTDNHLSPVEIQLLYHFRDQR